eukprot:134446-Pleurochrysis_carterae.AAC.3
MAGGICTCAYSSTVCFLCTRVRCASRTWNGLRASATGRWQGPMFSVRGPAGAMQDMAFLAGANREARQPNA